MKPTSPRLSSDAAEEVRQSNREPDQVAPAHSVTAHSVTAHSVTAHSVTERVLPKIQYADELPIAAHRDELVRLISQHQAIVVCGETGSGKSTQLPKFCIEAGLGRNRMIGHTQPRRLAARSIAARLSEELETSLGQQVGYKVRFGDQTSDQTMVKLMTDGILLAETGSDKNLDAYDAIIIDEAHERSLNIDFLLGYLRRLQSRRPDLKIIITSATIDADRFAEHFADGETPAPIVNVEGRGYPVELRYLSWEDIVDDETRSYDLSRHVIEGIQNVSRDGDGDTLVFLPTERDIREVSHRVAGHYKRIGMEGRVDLLPLYARLPESQQQKIFKPDGKKRRIIFATNVAESSLTVPGIRYVIDNGTARISRFSPRSKVQRLPVESVSQASANQRSGRCGRIGPGICVRLYSSEDFEGREAYTTPEIRRTNLAAVVLQMKSLRLGRLEDFPLLDPPRPEAIRDGLKTLTELGAIDDRHELTVIGRSLGRMPVDPRVGRIILAASENGVLAEVLPIAAALELPDPRDRPPDKQQAADEAHSEFVDPNSDFLSYLRLWRFYEDARGQYSRSKLTRVLRSKFLSPNRMREWADIYRQLKQMASESARRSKPKSSQKKVVDKADDKAAHSNRHDSGRGSGRVTGRGSSKIRYLDASEQDIVSRDHYELIHRSLLAGLLSGVATIGDKNQYTGAGGLKLFLWPGSGLFGAKPKWIVAAELVETAKTFARTVARVQPLWIEQTADHLLKASHHEPHFSGKAGAAFCYENRTLYGLPIVTRRRVPLAPLDPATARDLLVEHGLVGRELRTTAKFVRANQSLQKAIETLAAKTRRRDLVIDDYAIEAFYQERLPETVTDRARLEKFDKTVPAPQWAKSLTDSSTVANWLADPPKNLTSDDQANPDTAPSIYQRPDDLVQTDVTPLTKEAFPDELVVGGSRLPLTYRFNPGDQRDGVNLTIHQAAISQISDDRLGWLVPGLLHGKIVTMIKSLPKRIRRNLVPAIDTATKVVDELMPIYGQAPFHQTVCEALSRHAEMRINADDFQDEKIDPHLDMLVTVVDDEGKSVAEARSIKPLVEKLGSSAPQLSSDGADVQDGSDESWHRSEMKTFDIESLPKQVIRTRGGVQVAQFPGLNTSLQKSGQRVVSTKLYADLLSAERSIALGCISLYASCEKKDLRAQVRWLPSLAEAKIKLAHVIPSSEIEDQLTRLLARIGFVESDDLIRTSEMFEQRRSERGRRIAEATQQVAGWLADLTEAAFELRKTLESFGKGHRYAQAVADINQQNKWLRFDGFLGDVPWAWLQHYPRYFKAMNLRLDKLRSGQSSRDDESTVEIDQLWTRWRSTVSEQQFAPNLQSESEFRWMIEELRVSLFAQQLGTSTKVSARRCEKLL